MPLTGPFQGSSGRTWFPLSSKGLVGTRGPGPPKNQNLADHTDIESDLNKRGGLDLRVSTHHSLGSVDSLSTIQARSHQREKNKNPKNTTHKTTAKTHERTKNGDHLVNQNLLSKYQKQKREHKVQGERGVEHCLGKIERRWGQNGSQKLMAVRTGGHSQKAQPDNNSDDPYEEVPLR